MTLDANIQMVDALSEAGHKSKIAIKAKEYLDHPPPDSYGLSLDWIWGKSGNEEGYLAIRRYVTERVEAQMPDLVCAAVRKIQREAEELRWRAADLMHHADPRQ